jgi:hypothetical protein
MMIGKVGKELADHLKARFTMPVLAASKGEIQKLSSEQGLLGNVYIDASAFTTGVEAEQFLAQHRNRLAQYIVVNAGKLNENTVNLLASRFHKNIVASINYDSDVFLTYKAHLVDAGKIASSDVIDSKESLRQAFLAQPKKAQEEPKKVVEEKKLTKDEVSQGIAQMADKAARDSFLSEESLRFKKVWPIIVTAREELSKGRDAYGLKEILRKKYAVEDLKAAAKYLVIISSNDNMKKLDSLVASYKIPELAVDPLVKLAASKPIKVVEEDKVTVEKPIGVQAFFHTPQARVTDEKVQAAVEQLRSGKTIIEVTAGLKASMSLNDAMKITSDAVNLYNITGAGVVANVFVAKPKEKVVEDLPEPETLPDAQRTAAQTEEIVSFFQDSSSMDVLIDGPRTKSASVEVDDMYRASGIDLVI